MRRKKGSDRERWSRGERRGRDRVRRDGEGRMREER